MYKDENGKMKYGETDFAAPTLGEDIVEVTTDTHRAEDGRTLHHIRGESGAIYYCEAGDVEGIRENIRLSGANSRYQAPPFSEKVITLALIFGLPVLGTSIWGLEFIKAIAPLAFVLLVLFIYILWIFGSATT